MFVTINLGSATLLLFWMSIYTQKINTTNLRLLYMLQLKESQNLIGSKHFDLEQCKQEFWQARGLCQKIKKCSVTKFHFKPFPAINYNKTSFIKKLLFGHLGVCLVKFGQFSRILSYSHRAKLQKIKMSHFSKKCKQRERQTE